MNDYQQTLSTKFGKFKKDTNLNFNDAEKDTLKTKFNIVLDPAVDINMTSVLKINGGNEEHLLFGKVLAWIFNNHPEWKDKTQHQYYKGKYIRSLNDDGSDASDDEEEEAPRKRLRVAARGGQKKSSDTDGELKQALKRRYEEVCDWIEAYPDKKSYQVEMLAKVDDKVKEMIAKAEQKKVEVNVKIVELKLKHEEYLNKKAKYCVILKELGESDNESETLEVEDDEESGEEEGEGEEGGEEEE
jgi:hypothetical protein